MQKGAQVYRNEMYMSTTYLHLKNAWQQVLLCCYCSLLCNFCGISVAMSLPKRRADSNIIIINFKGNIIIIVVGVNVVVSVSFVFVLALCCFCDWQRSGWSASGQWRSIASELSEQIFYVLCGRAPKTIQKHQKYFFLAYLNKEKLKKNSFSY